MYKIAENVINFLTEATKKMESAINNLGNKLLQWWKPTEPSSRKVTICISNDITLLHN